MKYDQLLYLDAEFLSEKYEEQTGVAPNTVVSKNEGMKAQAVEMGSSLRLTLAQN